MDSFSEIADKLFGSPIDCHSRHAKVTSQIWRDYECRSLISFRENLQKYFHSVHDMKSIYSNDTLKLFIRKVLEIAVKRYFGI